VGTTPAQLRYNPTVIIVKMMQGQSDLPQLIRTLETGGASANFLDRGQ
jgi:hypothetical protein